MLLLLKVVNADGNFYTRIQSESGAWITAHIILLLSAVTLLPAALGIRTLILGRNTGRVATIMVPLIAISSALLSGQYAIDFLMPEIARLGGEAHEVHSFLSSDGLVNMLFYNLPELSSLGLLIMSLALIFDNKLGKILSTILLLNWILIISGNLISPILQRSALFMLGFTFLLILYKMKDRINLE